MGFACISFCFVATLIGFNSNFCQLNTPITTIPSTTPRAASATPWAPSTTLTLSDDQWVEFTPALIGDNKMVKTHDKKAKEYVIIRYTDNGNVSITDAKIYSNGTLVPRVHIDVIPNNIQVLVMDPRHYEWVGSSKNTINKNPIEGGKMNSETVYICRINREHDFYAGMLRLSYGYCIVESSNSHYFSYDLLIHRI